ncbi:hypothetical protein FD05_GL002248 [Lentilactobacillus otakiensis DSM 19908 = JCM 15040]|nr:hypothetical protein [Lentilactobacillus otakiensis]KRL11610.1 hypothetical protein FD05_GL002248 [Lentilactobacillus otakiensis DSM 19908 = JCM 15040]MBZ3776768.1 hypothetical protein [Lentilactobacillus otakiensis]
MVWPVILHFLFDWQAGMAVSHVFTGVVAWPAFLIVWGFFLIVTLIFLISYDRNVNHSRPLSSYRTS